jgi:hypothetical protein
MAGFYIPKSVLSMTFVIQLCYVTKMCRSNNDFIFWLFRWSSEGNFVVGPSMFIVPDGINLGQVSNTIELA